MRITIFILNLLTSFFGYSQKKLPYVGKQILNSDSVFIYALPKTPTTNLSDTSCCNMQLYKDSFNISVRLNLKAKTELGNTLIESKAYVGRYASRSGFTPTEIIVLWKKGKFEYVKVSRWTHDMFYSKGSTWVFINPLDVHNIERFYRKHKIINN